MPDDLAEQINWVHEACEALGVPILTAPGYEADDVIGTLAPRAPWPPASTWRSCRSTRTSSSWSATASASTTRARTAPGSTQHGVVEKFGVQAVAGRRRAGARRRHQRQRRRRARHRQEGRDRPGHAVRQPRRAARAHGRAEAEAARGADDAPRRRAAEPRAGHHPHRRAARRRLRVAALPRRRRASAATSCSRGWRSARWSTTTRRPPTRSRRTTRSSTTLEELDALSPSCAPPGEFAFRVIPDQPLGRCARRSSASRSRPRDRQARYVPLGHESGDGSDDLLARRRRADAGRPAARRSSGCKPLLEDAAIRKVGHDLKFDVDRAGAARHRRCAALAFDSMLASYLLDATRSGPRARGDRRSSTSATRR